MKKKIASMNSLKSALDAQLNACVAEAKGHIEKASNGATQMNQELQKLHALQLCEIGDKMRKFSIAFNTLTVYCGSLVKRGRASDVTGVDHELRRTINITLREFDSFVRHFSAPVIRFRPPEDGHGIGTLVKRSSKVWVDDGMDEETDMEVSSEEEDNDTETQNGKEDEVNASNGDLSESSSPPKRPKRRDDPKQQKKKSPEKMQVLIIFSTS